MARSQRPNLVVCAQAHELKNDQESGFGPTATTRKFLRIQEWREKRRKRMKKHTLGGIHDQRSGFAQSIANQGFPVVSLQRAHGNPREYAVGKVQVARHPIHRQPIRSDHTRVHHDLYPRPVEQRALDSWGIRPVDSPLLRVVAECMHVTGAVDEQPLRRCVRADETDLVPNREHKPRGPGAVHGLAYALVTRLQLVPGRACALVGAFQVQTELAAPVQLVRLALVHILAVFAVGFELEASVAGAHVARGDVGAYLSALVVLSARTFIRVTRTLVRRVLAVTDTVTNTAVGNALAALTLKLASLTCGRGSCGANVVTLVRPVDAVHDAVAPGHKRHARPAGAGELISSARDVSTARLVRAVEAVWVGVTAQTPRYALAVGAPGRGKPAHMVWIHWSFSIRLEIWQVVQYFAARQNKTTKDIQWYYPLGCLITLYLITP